MRIGFDLLRSGLLWLCAAAASAQGLQSRAPPPEVTAAVAAWQIHDEPIVVSGLTYYPTHEARIFDPLVMTPIDIYQGVPIYVDTTAEPFALAYVPLSRDRMRTYERPRDPDFPTVSGRGIVVPTPATIPVGTGSTIGPPAVSTIATASPAEPTRVESVPRPRSSKGVWVMFGGRRHYSDGAAVPYKVDEFVQIGTYDGFPVYRERRDDATRIWIPCVPGGPLVPYARRP